jgi:glycine cleavage system regulatory protein
MTPQEAFDKFLAKKPARVEKLTTEYSKAKSEAEEIFSQALIATDNTFTAGMQAIEDEFVKLRDALNLEIEEQRKKEVDAILKVAVESGLVGTKK